MCTYTHIRMYLDEYSSNITWQLSLVLIKGGTYNNQLVRRLMSYELKHATNI